MIRILTKSTFRKSGVKSCQRLAIAFGSCFALTLFQRWILKVEIQLKYKFQ
jgi:hypothetical protein